ncbi:type I restriction endonuclease [Haliangium sp. UPWRP_2]|uniref:type I restriction endonuclease n=1 Tax=Haliangium sp. UPWRP_2 TaxID=1931276 RepID=UPI000B53FB88|nr:type I restriction endonuclease [Haliangium sp. UPWRP_2]PSM31410.1 hypothetical protein BVG81_005555 [Haliangium sp. UPWRP_2]
MGLFEDLRNLSEQIKKRQAHVKGEEATKQALVLPFLQVLGFDIYDPTEVKPEYVADFAKKKSNGQFEKIDYSIYIKGEPSIFVECKAVDAAVEDHDGQLARYFNSTLSVKLAVLTNGLRYRFFTDLRALNVMDPTPFLEFNILRVTEREADLIKPFTKENFNSSIIQRHAEEVISLEKVTALVNELLRNPSENFIRFILSELELVGGRVTASVVSRFEPIIKKSIQSALLGMMTKSIQQEIAPAATVPVTAPPPPEPPQARPSDKATPAAQVEPVPQRAALPKPVAGLPVEPSTGAKDGGVVTTEEELEVFRAVSAICSESPAKMPVKYKDGTNFFAINLGPVRTWFLRLFAGSRRKSFMVRLPAVQAEPLVRNVQVEPVPENPDKCRVYFSSVADVEKLRPLILRAYEDAVRRQASGVADGDESAE